MTRNNFVADGLQRATKATQTKQTVRIKMALTNAAMGSSFCNFAFVV